MKALGVEAPRLPGGYWRDPSTATVEEWNRTTEAELQKVEAEQAEAERREREREIRRKMAEAVAECARTETEKRQARQMARRAAEEIASGSIARAARVRSENVGEASTGDDSGRAARVRSENVLLPERLSALVNAMPVGATTEEHRVLRQRLVGLASAASSELESPACDG